MAKKNFDLRFASYSEIHLIENMISEIKKKKEAILSYIGRMALIFFKYVTWNIERDLTAKNCILG